MCLKCLMVIWVWGHFIVNTLSQSDPNERAHHKAIAAQKGSVPPCVPQGGQTFCENVAGYPSDLILNALGRYKFDITKLFIDESTDDAPNFSSMITPSNTQSKDRKLTDQLLDDGVTPLLAIGLPLRISRVRFTKQFTIDNSTLTMSLGVCSFRISTGLSQINRYRRLDQPSVTSGASLRQFNSGRGYFHQYFGCHQIPTTIRN
ncbi:uncharacterized protein [Euwallacea fornicatus]|uniref:uncharacterized protein isoform X2 n=1 Tax=Euwallacea fornicatus TaxID=995702 RepID=UPI00338D660C